MIEDKHLDEDAAKALATGTPIEREVRDEDGGLFTRTVEPYKSDVGGIIATYKPIEAPAPEDEKTRSDFLMRELDHRVKNMLAIILSIAEITARSNTDISTYKNDFRARLESMARTHNLLAGSQWTGLDLRTLVEEELFSLAPEEAVEIAGPSISVAPAAAQSLAMFLHELVANAAKYGALSCDGGKIAISWEIVSDPVNTLRLNWQESDGPPAIKPAQDGFGGKVINRIVKRQLDAQVETHWDASGMSLSAEFPMGSICPSSE